MDSRELIKIRQELSELRRQHRQVAQRISKLENKLGVWEEKALHPPPKQDQQSLANNATPFQERPSKQKSDRNLEFRIGGTWFNRIGVVAVILGLTLFLKYAFDNDWIGPTGRVLLGIIAGIAMLVAGERFQQRYPAYAQGLLGGGNLALFVSVYAAHEFYRLIVPTYAFAFFLMVMINTVFMAVRHSSIPIGVFGIIGGFFIPFLIRSADPSAWPLVIYLILLTSGVLAISLYKRWVIFQYLSFVFNQIFLVYVFNQFLGGFYRTVYLIPVSTYLLAVFALYLGVGTIYNLLHKKKARGLDISLITINAFLFFIWSLTLLRSTVVADYLGFYALLLALMYIYTGKTAYRIFPEDRLQAYSLYAISFVFITVAIPLQFVGVYIGIAWLAEALGLFFIARRLQSRKVAYVGLAVLALGLASTYHHLEMLWYHKTFLLNFPTLILVSSLAAIWISIKFTEDTEGLKVFNLHVADILKALFLLQIFIGLSVQNKHYFTLNYQDFFLSPQQLSLSGIWLVYAIVLFAWGIRKNNRYLRYSSLGLLAIIILKAFFVDLANLDSMFKIFLFIILGLSLLGVSFIYQRKKDTLQKEGEDV